MKNKTINSLNNLCNKYEMVMQVMEGNAAKSIEEDGRAYGGFIRMAKGKLQENITESLINIAWVDELGYQASRLKINSNKINIPIRKNYIKNISSAKVRNYIESKISEYKYGLSVDKHVFIDNKFILGIECKAYTENAMLKRILVDFMLLKTKYPNLGTYLFQLESMLGGDYEQAKSEPIGSIQSHSIMSYFENIDLKILTLLKGKRKVNQPINKPEHFKPLELEALKEGVNLMVKALKNHK
jgi:hypothetical protein